MLTGIKASEIIVCPATIKNVPSNPPRILMDTKVDRFGARAAPTEHRHATNIAEM